MKRLHCFNDLISKQFYRYGRLIARHPAIFLFVPIAIAAFLSSGMIFIAIETDAQYLFTPENSRANMEVATMKELFPVDHEKFLPNRIHQLRELSGFVIAVAKGPSVLTEEAMDDILHLDRVIKSIELNNVPSNSSIHFEDLCCHFIQSECLHNPVLKLLNYTTENVNTVNFTYPLSYLDISDLPVPAEVEIPFEIIPDILDEVGSQIPLDYLDYLSVFDDVDLFLHAGRENVSINIGASLGGIELRENTNVLKSAKAIMLVYFLRSGNEEEQLLGAQWELKFLETVRRVSEGYQHIDVFLFTSNSVSDELVAMAFRVIPRFVLTFCIIINFAVMSCMMADWVKSKPWLGQFGVMSAMLAIASTMGLLSFCGVKFNEVSASMPFLAVGIGIDDMFIMLAAWRKTSMQLPVEERMGLTYSEAAVSITITSVTDALAFGIGSITKLPAIRIFCLYTGVAIILDYLFQITFFGACMVYTGRREAQNKHCTTMRKVKPKDEAPSKLYSLFCAGGNSETSLKAENREHAIMQFFKKYYGPFITAPLVKLAVVMLFLVYVGSAVFGCLHITEGMQYKDIFSDNSYAHHYMIAQSEYFTAFAAPVAFVINEPLPYWEEDTQLLLENITRTFEDNELIYESNFTESWLRDFLSYLKIQDTTYMLDNDTSVKENFMNRLRNEFLAHPLYEQYTLDVNFGEDSSGELQILSSRMLLMAGNLVNTKLESQLMQDVRTVADAAPFAAIVSSPPFEFHEQYLVVLPNTFQNLVIATVCMCIISLVFIPHPLSAVMITVCVISIEMGVIGFMSLWNVNLDGVSMINIILCIGFSVDFSAHITYSFVTANVATANEAAVAALHSLGLPVLQGALSTILGILVLASSPAYIFRSFFKTMFLVMTLGLLHALVFLPVLLTFIHPYLHHRKAKKPATKRNVEDAAQDGQRFESMLEKQSEGNKECVSLESFSIQKKEILNSDDKDS